MPVSEAQRKSNAKHDAANFEYFTVKAKKGTREALKAYAATVGESLNGFINRVLHEAMKRDTDGEQSEQV